MKKIYRGSKGEAVLIWQGILGIGESGEFDEETDSATRRWQEHRGLNPDGVVGGLTWGLAGFAGEKRVETVRTAITERDYLIAFIQEFPDGRPTKEQAGCALAQYLVETGGRACFNFNVGNTKDHEQDGYDYFCLNGVWEGFPPAVAEGYIARGEAVRDTNAGHIAAVGPDKVSIVFSPPHPMTRFRAYPDLRSSMRHHLGMLGQHYKAAWACLLLGKARECGLALGAGGYFTANANVYATKMQQIWNDYMKRSTFEEALMMVEQDDTPTSPAIPNPASEPTIVATTEIVRAHIFSDDDPRGVEPDESA